MRVCRQQVLAVQEGQGDEESNGSRNEEMTFQAVEETKDGTLEATFDSEMIPNVKGQDMPNDQLQATVSSIKKDILDDSFSSLFELSS